AGAPRGPVGAGPGAGLLGVGDGATGERPQLTANTSASREVKRGTCMSSQVALSGGRSQSESVLRAPSMIRHAKRRHQSAREHILSTVRAQTIPDRSTVGGPP